MNSCKLFLVGTKSSSVRPGEPAEIVGVDEVVLPQRISGRKRPCKQTRRRPCFRIRFQDGTEAHTPIFTDPYDKKRNWDYAFITEEDIATGRIPKVY